MISLRYYQKDSISELRNGFKNHQRQVLCLPTGAGKTVVFSEMVRLAAEKSTITVVFTDRIELFKQTVKSLGKIGVAVEEVLPNKKVIFSGATIYLAMIETIKRRTELIAILKPKLLIIDEAHRGNFTKILDVFPDAKVIGATATPIGNHFSKYYTNIVQNIDVPELVEEGFLVNCRPYKMVDDFSDLEAKRGEFTDESLSTHFNSPTLYEGMIDEWKRLGGDKKTIVFNVNIKHTIAVTEAFKSAGISSEYITSQTHKNERDKILHAFSAGAFQVLNNCGILTTGYDEPTIEFVVMNRATKSESLWKQCVGRGSRLIENYIGQLPEKEERLKAISLSSKPNFYLLDCGGNHDRLGMWNESRVYDLKEKKKRDGVAPVKECKNCESLNWASALICAFCGEAFEIKYTEPVKGIAIEVIPKTPDTLRGKRISDLTIDELIELQNSKKYKPSFVWRVIRSFGEQSILEYAKKMNYKSGWINRQIDDVDNSEYTNYKLI